MNKQVAIHLKEKAEEVAKAFSNPNRDHNHTNEEFSVKSVRPLSDHMAAVIYKKTSGKLAVALFYYIPAKTRWEYFFPTDSHILGLYQIPQLKHNIEEYNYSANFD